MSISPDYRRDSPQYRERSTSFRSSHYYRRQNGHKSPYRNSRKHHRYDHFDERDRNSSYYESDRDYGRWNIERKSRSRGREYRDRERDRYYHDRDYDPHRDRDYHRRKDRSRCSRWERKSEDGKKVRDRDRGYREDSSDRYESEQNSNGAVIGASGSEIIGYKSQLPNNTIMISRLAQHITENDIRQDIIACGLMAKDIRLIRKKDTGASRGFAFVEFASLSEATRWMNMKQGVLILQDQFRAMMQYSISKELCQNSENPPSHKASADWFCIKCGGQNFKRRENCFNCHASRMESKEGGSGSDEVCNYATKTIMLRNLDALTTEDSVMSVFNTVIPDLVKTICAVCIGRDQLTSTSRGICYLGFESTVDALALYGALNLLSPLTIDGKTVILSYCKYNMGDTKKSYSQADNAAIPNASVSATYGMGDVDSLAEYSASRYAKTPVEYHQYYEFYKNYFAQQISAGNSTTLQIKNQMDTANVAAAVAQSAIQQINANKTFFDNTHMTIPSGTDKKRYPVPDVSKYTYDTNSGYQYDPSTGLYYDPNSNYYWNSVIQKYLYWDQEKLTYILAPTTYENYTGMQQSIPVNHEPETKNQKAEKQVKVKVAKKSAKDMERWAKTLNQKKESSSARVNQDAANVVNDIGTALADVGFAVLEKKNVNVQLSAHLFSKDIQEELSHGAPLVAQYGEESESSSDEEPIPDDTEYLDFAKLICNLCKRQLSSAKALTKHAQLSSLHKRNLEARHTRKKPESSPETVVYRDRTKERRMKYGDSDEPQPNKLKEKYLRSRELVDSIRSSGSENVRNKIIQKMDWTEGQGLGRINQSRTTIIQVEQRSSTVGLGNKAAAYSAVARESDKE